jgi:hypothetical protein
MRQSEKVKLLGGPYRPPALERGQITTCLFRKQVVVILGWSNAPIPWPICKKPGRGGGQGLLADEELLRAIRTESALALAYWWGMTTAQVWRWRKAFGIGRYDTPGSVRLTRYARQKAGAAKARNWSAEEREERRRRAIELNDGAYLLPGHKYHPNWTAKELALLGKLSDEDAAKQLGRTLAAVKTQRTRRGIAPALDERKLKAG